LSKLSPHERDHVFRVIGIVILDTASAILGTLDGTHFPGPLSRDFIATFDNEVNQGDLLDVLNKNAQARGFMTLAGTDSVLLRWRNRHRLPSTSRQTDIRTFERSRI